MRKRAREWGKRMCCESADWRIPALLAVAQNRFVGCMNMYVDVDGLFPGMEQVMYYFNMLLCSAG